MGTFTSVFVTALMSAGQSVAKAVSDMTVNASASHDNPLQAIKSLFIDLASWGYSIGEWFVMVWIRIMSYHGRQVTGSNLCNRRRADQRGIAPSRPFRRSSGAGGQPGIFTSTGMTFSTAPQLA